MLEDNNNTQTPIDVAAQARVSLTPREAEILRCLASGGADKQIADQLNISTRTVNHHINNILLKLNATNRVHAVTKAILLRIIDPAITEVMTHTAVASKI